MSYAKFQRDPPNGSAAILEKLMGGGLHPPPLHWRGLSKKHTNFENYIFIICCALCNGQKPVKLLRSLFERIFGTSSCSILNQAKMDVSFYN